MSIKVRLEVRNHPEMALTRRCAGCKKTKRRLKCEGKWCSAQCKNRGQNSALLVKAS